MTEQERVERYGRPVRSDEWIKSFPRWGQTRGGTPRPAELPMVLRSRHVFNTVL